MIGHYNSSTGFTETVPGSSSFTGTVQAEQLTSTDDASIADDLVVGGDLTAATLNGVTVLSGSVIPSAGAGVAATRPALYYRTGTDQVYQKTGSGDTAWSYLGPNVRPSRLMGTNGDFHSVSSSTFTSGQARAYYIGRTGEPRTSINLGFYLHGTAAAGAGWAEIAVATGPFTGLVTTNIDLTVLGYADISAEALAATTATYSKSLTGLTIAPDDDLWVIAACAFATTQMTFRIMNDDGDRIGARRKRDAFQPSTSIGTPATFAYAAGDPSTIMFGFLP